MDEAMETRGGLGSARVQGIRSWLRCFVEAADGPKLIDFDRLVDQHDGGGARVALLDGGLDWEHPVFSGAALLARDFTASRDLSDPASTGTAHASLLVGQAEGGFEGLMPHGELLFGRVLWPGTYDESAGAIARGLRWAAACDADVIVLPFSTWKRSRLVADAIVRAAQTGATIVAAGRKEGSHVSFPACLDEVVAVTGFDIDGRPAPLCCPAEQVDLAAPGSQIPAMGPRGPVSVGGSAPAAVLAAGILALRRAVERDTTEAVPTQAAVAPASFPDVDARVASA